MRKMNFLTCKVEATAAENSKDIIIIPMKQTGAGTDLVTTNPWTADMKGTQLCMTTDYAFVAGKD